MNLLIRSLSLLAASTLFVTVLLGQETPKSAETGAGNLWLVNETQGPECETALAMLDGFVVTVANDPAIVGHVVFFGGDDPVQNRYFEIFLNRYFVTRRIARERFTISIGETGPKTKLELWVGKNGERPRVKQTRLSRDLSAKGQPIYFDGELFEMFRQSGKVDFVGLACEACCFSPLSWSVLNEFLEANPTLKAYVIIRGAKQRRLAIRPFLTREIQDGGVPELRVTLIDGGKNKVNDNKQFSEVEVYLSNRKGLTASDFPSKFGL